MTHPLLQLLEIAVRKKLGPKRTTCAVLSGGLDSSSVVCVARKLGYELPCFTGYYEGEAYDERPWARLVAGEEHHEILITPSDFVAHFDACAMACEPPFQGIGTFGQYMVAKAIAEAGYEIVLSGEGSDELFGGYARQYIVAGHPAPDGYENYTLPDDYPRDLQAALDYDFARLGDLLAVDDQMLGAHGLEGRAPFTDTRLVSWALDLQPGNRVGKVILKDAMYGLVPHQILNRTDKRGFPAPLVEWAQEDPVKGYLHDRGIDPPDPAEPWSRGWFHQLIRNIQSQRVAA